jgi:hypothetical protein
MRNPGAGLKVISGYVNSFASSNILPTGVRVSHPATGQYNLYFDPEVIKVQSCAVTNAQSGNVYINTSVAGTNVTVNVVNSALAAADTALTFTAVGY